ncbi:hypothetical protein [Agromyces larvae]|uniref:Uncharacterized protein n=1 Tax=Agromyces larvae TaxID=2929802 RepID=A0ABY4BU70_9MICO|nr:hypothetical protein [Agromyces larvae]UOE42724.1 hypothetical protein MTO99_11030 [Agromyces larvae]
MPYDKIASIAPLDLIAAAFSTPLFSLAVAAVIAATLLIVSRIRRDRQTDPPIASSALESVTKHYRPEQIAVGVGAISVIAAFTIENVVRGYMMNLVDIVEWWQYATPVFAAAVCLTAVLVVILFRGSVPPERPVLPIARRTWTSFSSRGALLGAGVTLAVLLTTTIAAGLASSSDERGRYIYLEIAVPNVPIDPLWPWFYGWSFGVPVLVCLAALALATWATLRANATRPFRRPETVTAERATRAQIASGVALIATGGMLLALAGAWRFIGRSGTISQLIVGGDQRDHTYELSWRYAEFAAAGGFLAPALEITAFVLLLVVASRLGRASSSHSTVETTQQTPDPQVVR